MKVKLYRTWTHGDSYVVTVCHFVDLPVAPRVGEHISFNDTGLEIDWQDFGVHEVSHRLDRGEYWLEATQTEDVARRDYWNNSDQLIEKVALDVELYLKIGWKIEPLDTDWPDVLELLEQHEKTGE